VTWFWHRSAEGPTAMDLTLLSQYVLSGVVIGAIYSLMALGITFIYSIMKMINWSMGEFYMIGSYVQYVLRLRSPRRPRVACGHSA
jgi:branched-subunit amino acid ABC-type transport system permease component